MNCEKKMELKDTDVVKHHYPNSENDSDPENVVIVRGKRKPTKSTANSSDPSDEEEIPTVARVKSRIKQFSDSGSDNDKNKSKVGKVKSSSESESVTIHVTKQLQSSTDSDSKEITENKNEQQQLRMKNKRTKLRNKFKSLINTREKTKIENEYEQENKKISEDEDDDSASINIIKEKIKEKMSFIPSICDPDTSSDEESKELEKVKFKVSNQTKKRKSAQPTSPKPIRMTAKIAMENMQKIKSESNRMLREKQVSLPYHRPKALSLKDILSRRKPAVSDNGKTLPIKMNEEQLKQYAQQLEQRQKEIMELCKSDSDEENDTENANKNDEENDSENANKNDEENYTENTNMNDEKNDTEGSENNIVTSVDKICSKNDDQTIENELFHEKASDKPQGENNEDLNQEILSGKDTSTKETHTQITESETFTEDDFSTGMNTEISLNNVTTTDVTMDVAEKSNCNEGTEKDSQLISLHFDTEMNTENITKENVIEQETIDESKNDELFDDFFENDVNMINIEKIIDNAELNVDTNINKITPFPSKDETLNINPKLTGAPGMVIDLDDGDSTAPKKLSGVELLKERFTYFSTLKTPEEKERDRENSSKPGALLMKLKQELEEEIAEQRSLEWAKRLQDEKNHELELKALRGDTSDAEDEFDKIDKLAENLDKEESSSSEEEEDLIEDDVDMTDKPKKKNAFVTDEAEESECENDENADQVADDNADSYNADENNEDDAINEDKSDVNEGDDSDDSSESESEEEQSTVVKKGRILKAFEDSDDEDIKHSDLDVESNNTVKVTSQSETKEESKVENSESKQTNENIAVDEEKSQRISDSQDDVIQLAQAHRSVSDEIFTSLESVLVTSDKNKEDDSEILYNTQTFSILKSTSQLNNNGLENEDLSKTDTQSLYNFKDSTTKEWKQTFEPSQIPGTQNSQETSQPIGEDILALCTGNFYENEFISQNNTEEIHKSSLIAEKEHSTKSTDQEKVNNDEQNEVISNSDDKKAVAKNDDGKLLQTILDELHDPEFDTPKVNKYFPGNNQESMIKKKFVIDSDDEDNKTENIVSKKRKKKLEKRALQISDDEDDELESGEAEEYESEIDDENDGGNDKIVEYDSEENEVEVKIQCPKKKRKATEFFENEAELTSEDEWIGSGDEDEAGLDRMEREEGDDETFNQRKLQQELGQIHMRDVMDQDKREVRIIQELLFEDGDLGDGHRQRKFRWRNNDDDEQMGTVVGDYADTQEEEFESEEQWRKQRHEREIFLKRMQNKDEKEDLDISIDRTTIIKANLCSKTMSTLLQEMKKTDAQKTENTEKCSLEKKTTKDIPSPKKAYSIFQQNYHGSLLTRGNGALARLAALATPLATDEDATKIGSLVPTNRRNFVFASVTPDDEPKATKRKADTKPDTPRLMKKMKVTDKQAISKNSLLDHLKV